VGGAVTGAAPRAVATLPRPATVWSVQFASDAVLEAHRRLVRISSPLAAAVMLAGAPLLVVQSGPVDRRRGFLHLNGEVWWLKGGVYHPVAMGSRWLAGRTGWVRLATSGGYGVVPRNARLVVIVEDSAPAFSAGGLWGDVANPAGSAIRVTRVVLRLAVGVLPRRAASAGSGCRAGGTRAGRRSR